MSVTYIDINCGTDKRLYPETISSFDENDRKRIEAEIEEISKCEDEIELVY